MRGLAFACLVLLTACGGGGKPARVEPSAAPAAVAAAFMRAVADSNLTQMAELWGTSKGSAAATGQPADFLQRIAVMQLYLRGATTKVLGNGPVPGSGDRRQVMLELTRGGCVKQVPFTMVRTKDGAWLVNAVDLNAAGNPAKPCEGVPPEP